MRILLVFISIGLAGCAPAAVDPIPTLPEEFYGTYSFEMEGNYSALPFSNEEDFEPKFVFAKVSETSFDIFFKVTAVTIIKVRNVTLNQTCVIEDLFDDEDTKATPFMEGETLKLQEKNQPEKEGTTRWTFYVRGDYLFAGLEYIEHDRKSYVEVNFKRDTA